MQEPSALREGRPSSGSGLLSTLPLIIGLVAVGWLSLQVLVLAGRPLSTDDLWFHLKLGQLYSSEGLTLDREPMLHTVDVAPSPHAWLFQVSVAGVLEASGFQGLRLLHVAVVTAILALVYGLVLRETRWHPAASLALGLFLALAWYRLFQLRPDLVSIPAALAIYGLVLQRREPPGIAAVVGVVAILVVWVNAHSLFALGPAFLLAGGIGLAIRHGLLGLVEIGDRAAARARNALALRRVSAALGIGLLATLANPRGFAAHATFFASNAAQGIWLIGDDWRPFDPFRFEYRGDSLSVLSWVLVDGLLALFVVASLAWGVALWRRRSESNLERLDPVHFGLALASFIAIFGSIRFLWLGFFPVVFLLRGVVRPWEVASSGEIGERTETGARWLALAPAWGACLACVVLAFAVPRVGGLASWRDALPRSTRSYLAQPVDHGKYFAEGVRFLRETELEGRLFNVYHMGGYLGFWVTPQLRTFVDGRTRPELLRDLVAVLRQEALPDEASFLEVLDRRGVDVFFGVGVPSGRGGRTGREYSVPLLERAGPERWLLVSRSVRHAIYLRVLPRNVDNLRRVAAYYAAAGVPFDPARGLDVAAVVDRHPDYAMQHRLLPRDYPALVEASLHGTPDARLRALDTLAITWALLGLYPRQIEAETQALELRPEARAPRRRLVLAYLRRDRVKEAAEAMRALLALDPEDPRSRALLATSREYVRLREARGPRQPDSALNRFAWLGPRELARYNAHFAVR